MSFTKNWKLTLSIAWLITTIAFAAWWLINGLNLLKLNISLTADEVARYRVMLISEGITWLILLLLGGVTLIYLVVKEVKKNQETKNFVASFSHDLKTSIASLRLQAESLNEDIKDPDSQILIKRLIDDSLRLQIQLENSLEFSSENQIKLHMEEINFESMLESLSYHWPDINLVLKSDPVKILADKRAIDIIMRNLIYNAKVHADAENIFFTIKSNNKQNTIEIKNDGKNFTGDLNKLGDLYYRHNPSSGSGLGLYIVNSLMKMMSGEVRFTNNPFTVQLLFNKTC